MPRRAQARKRRTSGAVASMGRGETPGPRGEAKRLADAALRLSPLRFTALELSASCARAGFPHPGRPGRV